MRAPLLVSVVALVGLQGVIAVASIASMGCGGSGGDSSSAPIVLPAGDHAIDEIAEIYAATPSSNRWCGSSSNTLHLQIVALGNGTYEMTQDGKASCDSVSIECTQEKVRVVLDEKGQAQSTTLLGGSCTANQGAAFTLTLGARRYHAETSETSIKPGMIEDIDVSGGVATRISLVFAP